MNHPLTPCKWCGEKCIKFIDEVGLTWRLDPSPTPEDSGIPTFRLWHFRGTWGWVRPTFFWEPGKTYQEHDCPNDPAKTKTKEKEIMSGDPFGDPGGDFAQWKECLGLLLLLYVHDIQEGIKTVHGETDAIRADVIILDGPEPGKKLSDVLVFPRKLKGQLRGKIGGMVLGRLGQGQAQRGQNPPWELIPATDGEKNIARAYLTKTVEPPF